MNLSDPAYRAGFLVLVGCILSVLVGNVGKFLENLGGHPVWLFCNLLIISYPPPLILKDSNISPAWFCDLCFCDTLLLPQKA